MRIVSFFIPFWAVVVLFVLTRRVDLWWAYLSMIVGSELLLWLFHHIFKKHTAKEFVSGYVSSVVHYNKWVERVERTRTEYDSKGNSRTVTYYEYVTHPEYWERLFNIGKAEYITEAEFYEMCGMFRTPIEYFETYHHNCVSGGGGQQCFWDRDECHTKTKTFTHAYNNPILHSNSLFKYDRITAQDKATYELIDYPPVSKWQDQKCVCWQSGAAFYQDDLQETFQRLNAFCGAFHQIHVFVLLFDATRYGVEVAEMQRDYWKGGNKNEFTVCLGIDGEKVKWCHCFCWMDEPTLSVATEHYFLKNKKLDLVKFASWLRNNLDKWKRKEFKEFKYLGTNLSKKQNAWFFIISLLLAAICVLITGFWIPKAYNCFSFGDGYDQVIQLDTEIIICVLVPTTFLILKTKTATWIL